MNGDANQEKIDIKEKEEYQKILEDIRIVLLDSNKIRIQLFTLIVTIFGVLYGIAFTGQLTSDFILLIPIIIIIIGLRIDTRFVLIAEIN